MRATFRGGTKAVGTGGYWVDGKKGLSERKSAAEPVRRLRGNGKGLNNSMAKNGRY